APHYAPGRMDRREPVDRRGRHRVAGGGLSLAVANLRMAIGALLITPLGTAPDMRTLCWAGVTRSGGWALRDRWSVSDSSAQHPTRGAERCGGKPDLVDTTISRVRVTR